MRTFVISDIHGYPHLISNALDHGGFEPGRDAFVFAGDAVERDTMPRRRGSFVRPMPVAVPVEVA